VERLSERFLKKEGFSEKHGTTKSLSVEAALVTVGGQKMLPSAMVGETNRNFLRKAESKAESAPIAYDLEKVALRLAFTALAVQQKVCLLSYPGAFICCSVWERVYRGLLLLESVKFLDI
jgi:hypothetical protein